ncbi:secreted protein [Tibeticola sediminis]|jgi:hypothetical protein|uniref:Secreted protein n=1 Tax=Tibeticola sediminis TaxID=1917811 RepID=A0A3N4UQL3_9BURK|nr:formate dehydrogenase [Tibeticola sediminis]RPE72966.1 secreted protein [Tibeticola sediminis]
MRTSPEKLSRRRLFGGAATAGAVAAAATLLPSVREVAPEAAHPVPDDARRPSGYSLSEHVRRYYQTARS